MRHRHAHMPTSEAIALFQEARSFHLASSRADGTVVSRTLNGVVHEGYLVFHGASVGEKAQLTGREAVVSVEEMVAFLPSTFTHAERACSASTFYRSAQARGTIEAIADPQAKAHALETLMCRFQPQGGYLKLDPEVELYRGRIAATQVWRVSLAQIVGKAKLGQNRTPREIAEILQGLWQRGEVGDLRALELIRQANPEHHVPPFLQAPPGLRLVSLMGEAEADEAADLLVEAYWNYELSRAQIRSALMGSEVWVGMKDEEGRVVATVRALTDGAKTAWIYDVMVAPHRRGQGLGKRLVQFALDHPRLRHVAQVRLGTMDAQGLYQQFGFRDLKSLPPKPYVSTEMILKRLPPQTLGGSGE